MCKSVLATKVAPLLILSPLEGNGLLNMRPSSMMYIMNVYLCDDLYLSSCYFDVMMHSHLMEEHSLIKDGHII